MRRLVATLATIGRLALPYFRSEDRWPGRLLLAAVIGIELSIVACTVILNQWYNRFYNTLQNYDWDGFVSAIISFLRPCGRLHPPPRLSDLSQSMAADPLAALDDTDLFAAMAQHRQPLSHAASWRRCR